MVLLATEDTCGALIVGASDEMLLTGLRIGLAVIRRLRLRADFSGSQSVPPGELGDQRRGQHDHHEVVMFKDGHAYPEYVIWKTALVILGSAGLDSSLPVGVARRRLDSSSRR